MPANDVLLMMLFASGWMVQRGNFCLVAGVSAALDKRPDGLLLILSVALLSGAIWMWMTVPVEYTLSGRVFWVALAGSVFSGVGAALNKGCFFGTLTRLFNGDVHMLFSLAGLLTASVVIPPVMISEVTTAVRYPVWLYLLLLLATAAGWMTLQKRDTLQAALYLLVPGLTFGVLYPSTPGWSLSQLLFDCWHWFHRDTTIPGNRLIEFLMFISGMCARRLWHGRDIFPTLKPSRMVVNFIAGWIMMAGARLMGGGNDRLLFRALPSLTPTALLLLLIMCLSIAATLLLMRRSGHP